MRWQHVDWTQAACRDQNPELFFPVGTGEHANRQADQAKAVCARCSVAARCLDFALDVGATDGIWGGWTDQERRALPRPRRVPARPFGKRGGG
ncbi:WhiB family transcriptional regulator [Pseudonocardia acaciae]|uniref:WhiB family transcriptional regulator n=1 Tax=Pseudonocardia acaciae TaxID=551276 RepID=UPI00048D88C8|nr:WhiB family transcriptional regulator [Pseudonocardia acaciae]